MAETVKLTAAQQTMLRRATARGQASILDGIQFKMAKRDDLIERLEKATGPDREIDTAIEELFDPSFRDSTLRQATRYTASLDATVALVEEMLPGWQYGIEVRRAANGGNTAWVAPNEDSSRAKTAATPAIALLIALLRALSNMEKG